MLNLLFKKCLAFGVILLFALGGVVFPCSPASQEDVCVVIPTLEVFDTIQEAIDDPDTSNGHTIIVVSGKCIHERITVDKSLIIMGEVHPTDPLPIIDGQCMGDIITITANGVTIKNLVIENFDEEDEPVSCGPLYTAINVLSDDNVIKNNLIRRCPKGVYLNNGSSGNQVYANEITCNVANYTGIMLLNSSDNMIYSNNIVRASDAMGDGISLTGSSGNTIIANTLENHSYGILLVLNSDNNIIHHNNFLDSINESAIIENSLGSCDNNLWDNGDSSGGNYWSDHICVDADEDGICENPYPIPGGQQDDKDNYPLAAQWYPICGNVDGSPEPNFDENILDLVYLINYVTKGGPPPIPPWVGDVDGNCIINLDDVYYLRDHIYYNGPAPDCCDHEI